MADVEVLRGRKCHQKCHRPLETCFRGFPGCALSGLQYVRLKESGRVAQVVEQCPFKRLLSNAPTAGQSLPSGFPHNNRGKRLVFGAHCAPDCALKAEKETSKHACGGQL
jgi:hypothetical protein